MARYGFLLAFLLPILVFLGYYFGGWYNSITIIFVFVFIPLLDYFLGIDDSLLSESELLSGVDVT